MNGKTHESCGGSGPNGSLQPSGQDSAFGLLGAALRRVKGRSGCGTPQSLIDTCFGCDDERTVTPASAQTAVAVLA